MRAYLAIPIAGILGAAIAVALVSVTRLIGPDSLLVARGRLPLWWRNMTAWARSRSLRVWCPEPHTAVAVSAHLQTERGRRLVRLGVSIAQGPWEADVLVVEHRDTAQLDVARTCAPTPIATIVLADATDPVEFSDAVVALAVAHRWPDAGATR